MSVDVVEVSSNDPDLARATLSRLYAPGSNLQTLVTSRRIEFSVRAVQAGELHAGRFRHTLATRAAVAPFEDFVAAAVLSGELHLAAGREQRILRRGAVVHYPTTSALSGAWSGLDIVMLRIPMTTVEQAAGALTG